MRQCFAQADRLSKRRLMSIYRSPKSWSSCRLTIVAPSFSHLRHTWFSTGQRSTATSKVLSYSHQSIYNYSKESRSLFIVITYSTIFFQRGIAASDEGSGSVSSSPKDSSFVTLLEDRQSRVLHLGTAQQANVKKFLGLPRWTLFIHLSLCRICHYSI